VAGDRFEYVIGHAHLGQLSDDRVAQIVEAQPVQACSVTKGCGNRPRQAANISKSSKSSAILRLLSHLDIY
jgi:hypothetical protein